MVVDDQHCHTHLRILPHPPGRSAGKSLTGTAPTEPDSGVVDAVMEEAELLLPAAIDARTMPLGCPSVPE